MSIKDFSWNGLWLPLMAERTVSDLARKTKETIRSIKGVADAELG